MFNLGTHLTWFQNKIGSYDQQNWEASVEQRILHGLENRPKKEGSLNKELIDIDLVRGSTFSKAKPRHGLKYVVVNGLKRVILFPYYYHHWREHFTKEVIFLCLLHYFIQVLQLIIYFVWSHSTEIMPEEIILPLVVALCLGVLHAHIIAPCTTKRFRKKTIGSITSASNPGSPTMSHGVSNNTVINNFDGNSGNNVKLETLRSLDPIVEPETSVRRRKPSASYNKLENVVNNDDTGSELSDIAGPVENAVPESQTKDCVDNDTETKDSSDDNKPENVVFEKPCIGGSIPNIDITEPAVNTNKRVKICDNLGILRNLTVASVTAKGTHPDDEDLKKFISAKNKQIPDPTPVSSHKKEKKLSITGASGTMGTVSGGGGSQKSHKNNKSRRLNTNSFSFGPENISESLKVHKSTETEDITNPTDTNHTDDKINEVPNCNSQMSHAAAVENWIQNNSTLMETSGVGLPNGATFDESGSLHSHNNNQYHHRSHQKVNLVSLNMTNSDPVCVGGSCSSAVTSQSPCNDNETIEQLKCNSISQTYTPPNNSVDTINSDGICHSANANISSGIASSRFKHKIEVRKVSSADGSPGPYRKDCMSPFMAPNIVDTMTNSNTIVSSNRVHHPSLPPSGEGYSPRTGQEESATEDSQQQINILLNEDTITKSHRKREEFKALFESRAAENNLPRNHHNYHHRPSLATSHSSDRQSSSLSGSNERKAANELVQTTKRKQQRTIHKSSKSHKEILSMSETEYDRMNSDVNSTGASTSDGEEVVDIKEKTGHGSNDNIPIDNKPINSNKLDVRKSSSISIHANVNTGSSGKSSNVNESNKGITDVLNLRRNRDESGDDFGGTGQTVDATSSKRIDQELIEEDPFVLWYKEAHAPIPMHGVNDSVSCYVWEKDELKKTNLSLLDIGWSIIQAVERHNHQLSGISTFGFTVTVLLCFTPILFRAFFNWDNLHTVFTSSTAPLSASFINNNTTTYLTNCWTAYSNLIPVFVTGFCGSSWPIRILVLSGVLLRLSLYICTFLMLCVAENSFEQRLQYAKHFCRLTSSRRARKYYLPHFRLNKLANIKCWLSLRSYLKKRGPQRSVESIISGAFYMLLAMLSLVCVNLLQSKNGLFLQKLINWDLILCSFALGIFMLRFLVLGTKITKKYRNRSVIITEQINLFLAMQTRPHKKEDLNLAHNVLRLAENLLKEVEGPFRVCGWSMNPFLYNVLKVVILSVFSTVLSDAMGFKMKLYKIKLNPANW